MKVTRICLLVIAFGLCLTAGAQQPFEKYGYKVKIATLSNGKYVEFFDQDTLIEIGSVVLNRKTGKLVYFVMYDTVYSEATLKPDLISRWMSPDPLADERYEYSPYNFCRNNPIIFTDPTGALDEYYGVVNGTLTYLGSDGQGDNIRLVAEDRHEETTQILDNISVSSMHGNGASSGDLSTLRDADMSTVVTFNEGGIQQEAQGAHDRTVTSGLENSFVITLDPSTATVGAQAGNQGTESEVRNEFTSYDGGSGLWVDGATMALGTGHGHPTQTDGSINVPGYSQVDSRTAGTQPTYAIDSYNTPVGGAATIHQAQPHGQRGRSGTNPVGTTQQTNDVGRRTFLQVARPR